MSSHCFCHQFSLDPLIFLIFYLRAPRVSRIRLHRSIWLSHLAPLICRFGEYTMDPCSCLAGLLFPDNESVPVWSCLFYQPSPSLGFLPTPSATPSAIPQDMPAEHSLPDRTCIHKNVSTLSASGTSFSLKSLSKRSTLVISTRY